jgi:outer membrane biosynthesis protein TonB
LFLAGGFLLTVAAEFGIDAGIGGRAINESREIHAEVELVEYEPVSQDVPIAQEPVVTEEPIVAQEAVVAQEPLVTEEVVVAEQPPILEEPRQTEISTMPEPTPTATPEPIVSQEPDQLVQPTPLSTPVAKSQKAIASGTSNRSKTREKPVAPTPATAASGVQSARADYLRNPPPLYPAEAKRNRHQGVALFRVVVSAAGRADSVT